MIKRIERTRRKCVTSVFGLENFGTLEVIFCTRWGHDNSSQMLLHPTPVQRYIHLHCSFFSFLCGNRYWSQEGCQTVRQQVCMRSIRHKEQPGQWRDRCPRRRIGWNFWSHSGALACGNVFTSHTHVVHTVLRPPRCLDFWLIKILLWKPDNRFLRTTLIWLRTRRRASSFVLLYS